MADDPDEKYEISTNNPDLAGTLVPTGWLDPPSIPASPFNEIKIPPVSAAVFLCDDRRAWGHVQYKEYSPLITDSGIEDQPPQGARMHCRIWNDVTIFGETDLTLYVVIANNADNPLIVMGELSRGSAAEGFNANRIFKEEIAPRRYRVWSWGEKWPENPNMTIVVGSRDKGKPVDATVRILKTRHMETQVAIDFKLMNVQAGGHVRARTTVYIDADHEEPTEFLIEVESALGTTTAVRNVRPGVPLQIWIEDLDLSDDSPIAVHASVPSNPATPKFSTGFVFRRSKPPAWLDPSSGHTLRPGQPLKLISIMGVNSPVLLKIEGGGLIHEMTLSAAYPGAATVFNFPDMPWPPGTPLTLTWLAPFSPAFRPNVTHYVAGAVLELVGRTPGSPIRAGDILQFDLYVGGGVSVNVAYSGGGSNRLSSFKTPADSNRVVFALPDLRWTSDSPLLMKFTVPGWPSVITCNFLYLALPLSLAASTFNPLNTLTPNVQSMLSDADDPDASGAPSS